MEFSNQQVDYAKKNFYGPKDTGITFALSCFVPQFIAVIVYLILNAFKVNTNGLGMIIFSCAVGPIWYFCYFLIYNKKQKISPFVASKISFKMKWWHVLLPIMLAIICLFGFNYFITLTDIGLEKIGYVSQVDFGLPMDNFGWFILNVLLLAVLPAICEELMFRGIIFNGMIEMGESSAVFFSAFLFALFHGNASQTIYQFILGIVLAYTVVLTKNLVCAMILHFTNNFVVLLINYISQIYEFSMDIEFNALGITLSVLGAVLTGVLIWLIIWLIRRRQKKCESEQECIDRDKAQQNLLQRKIRRDIFTDRLLWIGMIFALTIWIADFIY